GLREHRVRAVLEPRVADIVAVRLPIAVDAQRALDQAADARPLMAMRIGGTAGRKRHAVAAPEQIALRETFECDRKQRRRAEAGPCSLGFGLTRFGQLEPPQCRASAFG